MAKQPTEYILDLRSPEEALKEIKPYIPEGLKLRFAEDYEEDRMRGGKREHACVSCRRNTELNLNYALQRDLQWDVTAFAGLCLQCGALNMTLEVSFCSYPQILKDGIFEFEKFNNHSTGYRFTEKADCKIGETRWQFRRETFIEKDSFTIHRHIVGPEIVKNRNVNAVSVASVRLFKKVEKSVEFLAEHHVEFDI